MMDYFFHGGPGLPYLFAFLMGLSMLIYGLLDGYDLGVGILSYFEKNKKNKDTMIASIGPFWDANETWLVLGVGILLIAFPLAHGIILTNLYLPVFLMLIGLIFRGVAFDFRAKAKDHYKKHWDTAFSAGSLLTALAQGYMLGFYIVGFKLTVETFVFSCLVGVSLAIGYCLIGANWLIMKTSDELQKKSIRWAKFSLVGAVFCIGLVSLGTPLASDRIFSKWFAYPNILFLLPIPVLTGILILWMRQILIKLPLKNDQYCWLPFVQTAVIAVLCFIGLGYSFFPFIIPDQMLIVQASSANESLIIILVGVAIVLPILLLYTFFSYKIFHGKAEEDLRYD
jgi:cytochrome d ubiquinol oxidase subunit II